jgi:hypothetical protein
MNHLHNLEVPHNFQGSPLIKFFLIIKVLNLNYLILLQDLAILFLVLLKLFQLMLVNQVFASNQKYYYLPFLKTLLNFIFLTHPKHFIEYFNLKELSPSNLF